MGLIEVQLSCVCLVITAVLTESEGTVHDAICGVPYDFAIKASGA